jgi:hypothetical protein
LFLFDQEVIIDNNDEFAKKLWGTEILNKDKYRDKLLWSIKERHINLFENFYEFEEDNSVKNFERVWSKFKANWKCFENCQKKMLLFEHGYEVISKSHEFFMQKRGVVLENFCREKVDQLANHKLMFDSFDQSFDRLKTKNIPERYQYDDHHRTLSDFFEEEKVINWKTKCENSASIFLFTKKVKIRSSKR